MPGKFEKKGINQIATMLDLNSHHIDQIRNYFIATNNEEKLSLQNSITPMFLKGFLNDLKSLFILEPENATKLISIAQRMGASNHIETLKEIQQQFYSQVAETYLSGDTNSDVEKLLEVNNQRFLNEVNYQKEINSAFILNERQNLKKTFQDSEKESEISDDEMVSAFNHVERGRLKNLFNKIEEAERKTQLVSEKFTLDYDLSRANVKFDKRRLQWPEVSGKKNTWKKFAIAASVVGILISSILVINTNKKSTNEIAKSDNKKGEVINKVDSNLINNESVNKAKELLADNKLKYKEVQVPVLKEPSLGFSAKEEKINIRFFDTKERIAELEKLTKTLVGAGGNNSYEIAIKNQIDSLQSLNNKYTFDGKAIALYVPNTSKVESFKLTDKYFIKIDGNVYRVIKSVKPTALNKVTDKNVLDKIDEIDFKQNN